MNSLPLHGRLLAAAASLFLVCPQLRGEETELVSQKPDGTYGSGVSRMVDVSGDGRFVLFLSESSELVAGDGNGLFDLFLRDLQLGTTERISVASDGTESDGDSFDGAISRDGRWVAFESSSSNFDPSDGNGSPDVYLRDRAAGTTMLVSRSPSGLAAGGRFPSISRDGDFVAFHSAATDLVPGGSNGFGQVFRWERATGAFVKVTVDATGIEGNNATYDSRISADGAVVAFTTYATNFPDVNDPNNRPRVYAKDLTTGFLERIDPGVQVPGRAYDSNVVDLTDDGRRVLFTSSIPFLPEDTNDYYDAFVCDRDLDTVERVSLATGGGELEDGGFANGLSQDGRRVAFWSRSAASNGDANGYSDVFVRDLDHGVTSLVSVGSEDRQGNDDSYAAGMSDDALVVAFESDATNLIDVDANFRIDVFARLRCGSAASWTRYGAGFPGRDGVVPLLTPSADPYRGTTITIALTNSSRLYTTAFLFVGLTRNSIPTSLGGTLLLDPIVLIAWPLTPYGGQLFADVPTNSWACGLPVDLQALELDPFAAKGVSFSEGLELTLGD